MILLEKLIFIKNPLLRRNIKSSNEKIKKKIRYFVSNRATYNRYRRNFSASHHGKKLRYYDVHKENKKIKFDKPNDYKLDPE